MGRKDAAKIAQQLIESTSHHSQNTPAHILEAVSTVRERHSMSTLGELAKGKADQWFDSNSPALIMVGEALRNTNIKDSSNGYSESPSPEINDSLQDSKILTNSRRCA